MTQKLLVQRKGEDYAPWEVERAWNHEYIIVNGGNTASLFLPPILVGYKIRIVLVKKPLGVIEDRISLLSALTSVYEIREQRIELPLCLIGARIKIISEGLIEGWWQ